MNTDLITLTGIHKTYTLGPALISVLENIDLSVKQGEFVAIMGPSGSGKSTLLHIIGCLDRPTAGEYLLDGKDVLSASDNDLSNIRASHIGFVFQTFNLLPQLNVLENVELPFMYSAIEKEKAAKQAISAIEQVGLSGRINHRPSELSGGEMQRVAIARALSIMPKLILADEPTGNLDSVTGRDILKLFQELHDKGTAIIMVTHDGNVADHAQRVMVVHDGKFGKTDP